MTKSNTSNPWVWMLTKIVNISFIFNVLIILSLFFVFTHRQKAPYFVTSIDSQALAITSMDMPNTSDEAVVQWASLATISCYTFDFVNYQSQFDKLSIFFTDSGWQGFTIGMKNSNMLDAVIGKKLIVNSVITKSPVVLKKGYLNGEYAWRIQIPLLITYQAASDLSTENILVNVLVSRVSTVDSYKGLGIVQFDSGHSDALTNSSTSLTD